MTHHVKHETIVIERVAYREACELSSKRIEIGSNQSGPSGLEVHRPNDYLTTPDWYDICSGVGEKEVKYYFCPD